MYNETYYRNEPVNKYVTLDNGLKGGDNVMAKKAAKKAAKKKVAKKKVAKKATKKTAKKKAAKKKK